MIKLSPFISFNIFAILVAVRDAFSHRFLEENSSPIYMLTIFCISTLFSAWVFRIFKEGLFNPLKEFKHFSKNDKQLTLKLGFSTTLSFLLTIYGIKFVGASLFSLVEHGLIPIVLIFMSVNLMKEKISLFRLAGILVSTIGIFVFLFFINNSETTIRPYWVLGIFFAILGTIFTSFSATYQKLQLDRQFSHGQILMYRFFIPSIMMLIISLFERPEVQLIETIKLIILGLFGFSLPLIFMCLGMVKSSLSRFSSYIILIPLYTFIFGPLAVSGEYEKLSSPLILMGIVMVLVGYFLAEFGNKDIA